jgi:hypothetical protein
MKQDGSMPPQKGSWIMHPQHTMQLSRWMRLVALSLLLGIGLMTGTMLASGKAHAATTLTVSDCSDDSQLQADVAQANSDNAGDTINFSCSGDIKLSSTLTITGSMTIDGSGQSVTLDGQNQMEVLDASSSDLTLNALIIADGSVPGNGGTGGGIFNSGTLSISNSTLSGNSVGEYGSGGGIANNIGGTLTISSSTLSNNSAPYSGDGGGIANFDGTVTIANSTIATNSATSGGGIANFDGTVTIANSTIATNSASVGGGGGIYNASGTVSSDGSIVAENTGGDCLNFGSLQDNGYNLDSDSSCFTAPTSLHTNPQLATLVNNGGPTQTMALQQGSPAIDVIPTSTNFCPKTDQRGNARPDNGETTCDMGAYEFSDPVDNDLGLTNMPSNITTNATSPQGAVVTYTPPSVVDEDNPLPTATCLPASGSTFAIGQTTVTCSVSDSDDSNSPVSQSFSVTVQPVLSVNVSNVTASEGSAFTGVVATGTAYGSSNPLSATISWGDGNSSTVSITPNPDGSYSVSGSHTYAEEGSYALSVSVKDSGSLSTSGNGTATVSDAALTLTHFVAGGARDGYAALGATFSDADPNGQVADYVATVNWGDGNTSTVKVYKNPFGQDFVLAGLHQYASKGTYSVTLTVSDAGGSQVSKTESVTVK